MEISDRLPQMLRARVGWIIAAIAVAGIVAIILVRRSSEDQGMPQPVAMTVTTMRLADVDLARGITANGSIFPWQEIVIGPEVGGYRVAAVNVDVGDVVKRGQELVRLRDDLLAADVASKRANVQQAQATLANAAAAYRRAASLTVSGALSQSDVDKLRSEELASQARVEVAKADLDAADLRLKFTRVTAPDDGVISVRNVTVGQIAQTGAEMLRMVRKGRVEWRAEIPESRLSEVKVGQPVKLTTADGTELQGKVRTVSPTVESTTRAGLVYVDIDSASARPGMFARGEIVLERTAAPMLPITSVVIQDGYSYVFVLTPDSTVERRHVETGLVKDNLIEIASGVLPNEQVVAKGAGFLKDRDSVKVVKPDVVKSGVE
jgi:RND family efflux transporter MFP subunit